MKETKPTGKNVTKQALLELVASLRTQLTSLRDQRESLYDQLASCEEKCKAQRQENIASQARLVVIEPQFAQLKAELTALKAMLEEKNEAFEKLAASKNESDKTALRYKALYWDAKEEIADQKQEIAMLREDLNTMQNLSPTEREQALNDRISSLQAIVERYKTKLRKARFGIQQL